MDEKIEKFKNGIFRLNTSKFGTVAELLVQEEYNLTDSDNNYYDKKDENNKKIEIKFSKALPKTPKITKENLVEQCINSSSNTNTPIKSTEITDSDFDCNFQQVKKKEFDYLYYGIFFEDKISIFGMDKNQLDKKGNNYSDKQHKGNQGEGQFHINQKTIEHHLKKYHLKDISYEDFYKKFSDKKGKN